jgi:hypothetical protein
MDKALTKKAPGRLLPLSPFSVKPITMSGTFKKRRLQFSMLDFTSFFFLTVIRLLTFGDQARVMQLCSTLRDGFRLAQNTVQILLQNARDYNGIACGLTPFLTQPSGQDIPIPLQRLAEFRHVRCMESSLPFHKYPILTFLDWRSVHIVPSVSLYDLTSFLHDIKMAYDLQTLEFRPDPEFIIQGGDFIQELNYLMKETLAKFGKLSQVITHQNTHWACWTSFIIETKYKVTIKLRPWEWYIFQNSAWRVAPNHFLFRTETLEVTFTRDGAFGASVTLALQDFDTPFNMPLNGSLVQYGDLWIMQHPKQPVGIPRRPPSHNPHGPGMEEPDLPEHATQIRQNFIINAQVLALASELKSA